MLHYSISLFDQIKVITFLFGSSRIGFDSFFGIINITEEVIQRLINFDINVNGDVNRLNLYGCHLYFVLGAALRNQKSNSYQQKQYNSYHEIAPSPIERFVPNTGSLFYCIILMRSLYCSNLLSGSRKLTSRRIP